MVLEEDFLVGDFFGLVVSEVDLEVVDLDEGDFVEVVVDLVFFMGEIVVVGGGFAGVAVVAAVPDVVLLVASAMMLVVDDVFNCYGLLRGGHRCVRYTRCPS